MLHWYAEELTRRCPDLNPTGLANQYRLQDILQVVQKEQVVKEPQTVCWRFPVEIDVRGNFLYVKLQEEWEHDNLLYLDFDNNEDQ